MLANARANASIADRLGGRWAISRVGYVVIVVGFTLSIFAGEVSATRSLNEAARWLVVCLVAALVFGLTLVVLDRWTPYRDRRTTPISLPVLVVATVITGVLIALTFALGAAALGLDVTQSLPVRIAGVVLIGSWFGFALTLLLDEIDRSRRTRSALIDRQVSGELASLQQTLLIEELRIELQRDVDRQLETAQHELDIRLQALAETPGVAPAGDIAVALRTLADDTVRPLSARLWATAAKQYPRVSWTKVLVNTVRREPLRPVALALVHVVGTALQTIDLFGVSVGLEMLALTVIAIFVVSLPANALMRRHPAKHGRIFLLAVLILEAQVVPLVLWRESVVRGSASATWAVTQVVTGVIVILLTSGFGSWRQQRLAVERSYLEDLNQESVVTLARSRAVAELARELSRTLHGSVQSKIVACAMVSEQAIESGDVEQLKAALLQAQEVLKSSRMDESRSRSVAAEVHRKVALWEGLCAFEVTLDEAVEAVVEHDQLATLTVGRVVEEGISNAIRHGDATTIWIALSETAESAIRVVITNNGSGLGDGVTPGLGSTFLDRAGAWSLTGGAEGTRLEVVVTTGS